jgi:hypothetical protein
MQKIATLKPKLYLHGQNYCEKLATENTELKVSIPWVGQSKWALKRMLSTTDILCKLICPSRIAKHCHKLQCHY